MIKFFQKYLQKKQNKSTKPSEPEYKYSIIFGVRTKHGRLDYSVDTNVINPFLVKTYKNLWLWYHSRSSEIYTIKSNNKEQLPVSNTISRKDIIDIYTTVKYKEKENA